MLDRRIVLVERSGDSTTQTNMADASACLTYVEYAHLLAVLIERSTSIFIQRVFPTYVRRMAPSLKVIPRVTNNQTAKKFIIFTIVTINSIHQNNTRTILS